MPGMVSPVADEREGLSAFLAQQRLVLRTTAYGLTDAQAAATPSASALSVGGLVKHVTQVERFWIGIVRGEDRERRGEQYADGFRLVDGETLALVLADYAEAAAETERTIAAIDDLGRAVPVPPGVPWFPADVDAWSVRWVLLHLIEETARHAGHADVVRETVDGATAFALMAGAEGWEPTPWVQPWQLPAARSSDESGAVPSSAGRK
jgi:uncharacterized damage-inducible protein DinB